MLDLKVKSTNIIIIGSWNIAILIPDWFKENFPAIVKEKEIPVEVSIGANTFRFSINDIQIQTSPDKLVLSPLIQDLEHYQIATQLSIGITEKLHHTPILAIGNNISFLLEQENFILFNNDAIQEHQNFYKNILKSGQFNSWQIKDSFAFEDNILNLIYDINKQKKIMNFNFHYPITNKSKIKKFLTEFSSNIQKSKDILQTLVE